MKLASPQYNMDQADQITQEELEPFLQNTDEGEVFGAYLRGIQLPGAQLEHRDWKQCRFDNCRFIGAKLKGNYFLDVLFKNCDFSNCDLSDCVFNRVRFEDCKLTGANFSSGGYHDTHFLDTVADYTVFTLSRSKSLWFTRCTLTEASLNDLTGKNYGFTESDLRRVDFRGTSLGGVNLVDNEIDGTSLSERELRGAIVSPVQAMELARLLGVIIAQ